MKINSSVGYVSSNTARVRRRYRGPVLASSVVVLSLLTISSPAFAARDRLMVKIQSSSLGKVLFTTADAALYTYKKDTKNHSNCNGSCLAVWPALTIAKGLTPTGRGVSGLGVIVRSNGERQVTWKGRPLYRFVSDTKGKVTGNGVAGFAAARVGAAVTTTTTGGYSY